MTSVTPTGASFTPWPRLPIELRRMIIKQLLQACDTTWQGHNFNKDYFLFTREVCYAFGQDVCLTSLKQATRERELQITEIEAETKTLGKQE